MLKYKIPQIVTLTRCFHKSSLLYTNVCTYLRTYKCDQLIIMLLWIYFRKEMKKELSINLTPSFLPVGVTGFEPATTRPPGANFKLSYFSISLIFRVNITECQMVIFYEFSSFCWQFRKNVSYLCHSNKSKINETLKELKYGTL